jgi:hypothetical protein
MPEKPKSAKSTNSPSKRKGNWKPKQEGFPPNELLKETLIKTYGRVSAAARLLNIDRTTVLQRIKKHDELKRAVVEARNFIVEYAELKLMTNVGAGDQRAIEFVLKNKGKGWNNRDEQEGGVKDLNYVINIFQESLEKMKPEPKQLEESTVIDVQVNGSQNGSSPP